VYKYKYSLNSKILQYKSRYVVKGFNYYKTFTLVTKPTSYKPLFIITAVNNLKIKQIDIKTAFFYSNINTEIYIKQSKGIKAY
jgi:hypothetical protein